MYIENLRIRNFRCFREVLLHLRYPGEGGRKDSLKCQNVNLLQGDNGAGKTSILKALALAILAPVIRESGFRPFFLVRRGKQTYRAIVDAGAILHGQDFTPASNRPSLQTRLHAEIHLRGDYESVLSKGMSGPSLAEDSSRHSSSEFDKQRTQRYRRVAGLFESQVARAPCYLASGDESEEQGAL